MKLRLSLPIICLTFAVVACGKKGNDAVTTPVAAPYPIGVPPPNPYPIPPIPGGNDLATFCNYYGGQLMSGNTLCKFTRNYQNNAWFSLQWGDLNTGIPVYVGERVMVNVSGSPRVYVGGANYATGTSSFVSGTSGYLTFQRFSSTYSVQSIQVQSCYSASNQRATCL